MKYMIEIPTSKVDKMSELCEDMLTIGGKLMHCISEMSEESEMGYRTYPPIGMRGGRYGSGMREHEWDSQGSQERGDYYPDPYMEGERRNRRGRHMPR